MGQKAKAFACKMCKTLNERKMSLMQVRLINQTQDKQQTAACVLKDVEDARKRERKRE